MFNARSPLESVGFQQHRAARPARENAGATDTSEECWPPCSRSPCPALPDS